MGINTIGKLYYFDFQLPSTKFLHENYSIIIYFGPLHYIKEASNRLYISVAKRLDSSAPIKYDHE